MRQWLSVRPRLSMLAAFIVLATACSPSEKGIVIIHAERSLFHPATQLTTFLYLFAAIPLARRSSDPRVVAALPLIGNIAIASYAVFNLLRSLEAVGYEPKTGGALAAGLAEAIFPLFLGAAAAAAASLLIAFNPGLADSRRRRSVVGSLTLILALAAFAALAAFSWYLWPGTNYLTRRNLARLPLGVAAAGLIVAAVSLVLPRRVAQTGTSRWFVVFAAVAAVAALLIWLVGERLTTFADTG